VAILLRYKLMEDEMTERLTVGAVGVGAVGTIVASCLADAGAEIIAVDVPVRLDQLRKFGLRARWLGREIQHEVKTAETIKSMGDKKPDCIFISTKACLLKEVMPEIAGSKARDSLIISAQNGIGTEDEIARYVSPQNVARMVINCIGSFCEDGVVKGDWLRPPNFFGTIVGHDEPRLARFVETLNASGLTSELVDPTTIKKKAFLKSVLNSALMPVCGIMNLTMKQAMQNRATRRLADDLLREGFAVASRLGYDYGPEIMETSMGYLDKGGDHHPSMSIDLQCRRPTEIDFINGKILEIGRGFDGLDLEVNRVLVSLIMMREVMNGTRGADDLPGYLF
jgi:2-dehydropantoate 2-reductase